MLFQIYLISIFVYAAALAIAFATFLNYFEKTYGITESKGMEHYVKVTFLKLLLISLIPFVRVIALLILIFQKDQLIVDE